MKSLILSLAFTVICCTVFSQNKKGTALRSISSNSGSAPLKQEITWPVYYKNGKGNDTFIIKPRPAVTTKFRI